jgi:hypothetical protein
MNCLRLVDANTVLVACMPPKSRTRRLPPPRVFDLRLLVVVSTYLSLFLPRSSHHTTHVAHSSVLRLLWASICSFPGKSFDPLLYDDAYTNDISTRVCVHYTLGGMETNMDVGPRWWGAEGGATGRTGQRGRRAVNLCIQCSSHFVLFASFEFMRVRI